VEPLRVGNGHADHAVSALRAGKPVILPTDTVYGLCASPYGEAPVRRAYELKGRDPSQPSAILAADVDMLFECVPELRSRVGPILRALLPGPLTLVVPNPAQRYRWLTGSNPDLIGVRVPQLPPTAVPILARVGAVMATSANLPGGRDPRTVGEIPGALIDGCEVVIDGGELPGTPSTVVDLTGGEPRVLREGAVPAEDVLARVSGAVSSGAVSTRG
jgi:L-threonylcarbamoyladenylate synthase